MIDSQSLRTALVRRTAGTSTRLVLQRMARPSGCQIISSLLVSMVCTRRPSACRLTVKAVRVDEWKRPVAACVVMSAMVAARPAAVDVQISSNRISASRLNGGALA